MKPIDRNPLEEQARLVARYVAGDLSRSERAEFEAWLVASPELAAEVEMERRLRRGIASAARRGWLPQQESVAPPPRSRHRAQRWQIAAAASVLLTVGLGISLSMRDDGGPELGKHALLSAQDGSGKAPLVVRLGKIRSLSGSPDIRMSRTALPSQLTVEPDVVILTCEDGAIELECAAGGVPQVSQYPEYEVDLVNRLGSTLAWRSARQQPVMRTQLAFTLRDPSMLEAGDYDLIVRGISTDHQEVVGRFWVQVSAN
jgi:hypothetical protein